jgi:tRNA/rRNA methyltransferase
MPLMEVKIILVEPNGPLNVGSIARVMKNFGLTQLIIVNPQCDPLDKEALKMAVHAKDILQKAKITENLTQALEGCKRAAATYGRDLSWNISPEPPRLVMPWLSEEVGQPSALIFGREDRGLTNEELNFAQRLICIPTNPEYSSLNLATAVGLCCYELAQITQSWDLSVYPDIKIDKYSHPKIDLAAIDIVEDYYQELESLLLSIGYLYPHTASSRMQKFKHLYNRVQLSSQEVSMLRGILSQVTWALKNKRNS